MREQALAPPFNLAGVPTFPGHKREQGVRQSASEDAVELTRQDESALVERAKSDPQAFGLLYDRYCRLIYAYFVSRAGDPTLAEDLTSQTFFQAMQAIGRYEQRGLPFRAWLYRIAANIMVSHARRQTPQWHAEEALNLRDPDPEPEASFLRLERALGLKAALATLAPDQREAIELRFGRDLRIKEIAAQMNRSEGAVKMLLLRGMESLRHRLGTEGDEGRDARP
jgi:RNA polymerase sigma-70 factor (ECF subfamily)